ncbi:MAG: hypothetical protein ACT4QA_05535 [Panacagrimonas sp.]
MNSRTPFVPSSAGPYVPSSRAAGVSREASRIEGMPGTSIRGIAAQWRYSVRTDFELMHYRPVSTPLWMRFAYPPYAGMQDG